MFQHSKSPRDRPSCPGRRKGGELSASKMPFLEHQKPMDANNRKLPNFQFAFMDAGYIKDVTCKTRWEVLL